VSDRNFHLVEYGFNKDRPFVVVDTNGLPVYKSENPNDAEKFYELSCNISGNFSDDSYAMIVTILRKINEDHNPSYWYVKSTPKLMGYSIATRSEVIIASHPRAEILVQIILLAREIYA
jgi:hypothetical protein